MPASGSSSELSSHQMAILSHPGVQKIARQWHSIRAERTSNGSCRSHRALEASSLPSCFVPFVFLPRLVTPALRLGVIGSLRPSVFYLFLLRYGRRSGQPSSSSLARRACVHGLPFSSPFFAAYGYLFSWSSSTGTLPEVRKCPWPLRRPRGDGNGGRFVRSPCLLRGAVCACCTPYTRYFLLFGPCTVMVH